MIFYIALFLLVLWFLGGIVWTVGKLIHILLVLAVVLVVWRLIRGR